MEMKEISEEVSSHLMELAHLKYPHLIKGNSAMNIDPKPVQGGQAEQSPPMGESTEED